MADIKVGLIHKLAELDKLNQTLRKRIEDDKKTQSSNRDPPSVPDNGLWSNSTKTTKNNMTEPRHEKSTRITEPAAGLETVGSTIQEEPNITANERNDQERRIEQKRDTRYERLSPGNKKTESSRPKPPKANGKAKHAMSSKNQETPQLTIATITTTEEFVIVTQDVTESQLSQHEANAAQAAEAAISARDDGEQGGKTMSVHDSFWNANGDTSCSLASVENHAEDLINAIEDGNNGQPRQHQTYDETNLPADRMNNDQVDYLQPFFPVS